jgi:hypothetical protein
MREVARAVPLTLPGANRHQCGGTLAREDVNRGVRKVGQSSRVIEIQMRRKDMPHVVALEPKAFDVPYGRIKTAASKPHEVRHGSEPSRVVHVGSSDAGVDESKAARRLEEKAVAREGRGQKKRRRSSAERAHACALQKMDVHGRDIPPCANVT